MAPIDILRNDECDRYHLPGSLGRRPTNRHGAFSVDPRCALNRIRGRKFRLIPTKTNTTCFRPSGSSKLASTNRGLSGSFSTTSSRISPSGG
jgi:hypothetical protein